MPCNLALTITKAAVSEERLLALLTDDLVAPIVTAFLTECGLALGETRLPRGGVEFAGDRLRLTIVGGRVTGRTSSPWPTPADRDLLARLMADLPAVLAEAVDQVFARKVQETLAAFGPVSAQRVPVDNEGVRQGATVLTLRLYPVAVPAATRRRDRDGGEQDSEGQMTNRPGIDLAGKIVRLAGEAVASADYGDRDRLFRVAGRFGARPCTAGTRTAGRLLAGCEELVRDGAAIERLVDERDATGSRNCRGDGSCRRGRPR